MQEQRAISPVGFQARRKGSYGIDAPYLLPVPLLLIGLNVFLAVNSRRTLPLFAALFIAASVGLGLYASRRGKFVVWERLLDQLSLKGNERVLDMGCGRGAVLLLAAQRLTTGLAVGVDLWRRHDQSGNDIEATRRNAEAEGVPDKVELQTGDMQALPFADDSFDLVLSNVAIHNIKHAAGRKKGIEEAVRVLRPGGRLLIADIRATNEYCARLKELGMSEMSYTGLGWRMWWGGPWMGTRLVKATKPIHKEQFQVPSSSPEFRT
jgi:SAM-dependent methyltransferase